LKSPSNILFEIKSTWLKSHFEIPENELFVFLIFYFIIDSY